MNSIEENKKYIDKILWFIPIKKLRYLLKSIIYSILDSENNIIKIKNELEKDIKNIKSTIDEYYFENKREIRYINKTINKKTVFLKKTNWWECEKPEENIFFITSKNILKKYNINLLYTEYDPDIEIFSVFGSKKLIKTSTSKVKIFYTGESVQQIHTSYMDNCINDCELSLGFNNSYKHNYIRFPLWIMYIFNISNINTKDFIKNKLMYINNTKYKKIKFASLIARWDGIYNLRTNIYNNLIHIDKIKCPSKLLYNDDTLKKEFNDNKIEYLKQFKFNICPENCIEDGYITEKIINAFQSGCIPIWNGDKNIERDVINKNAVLYWEKDNDNYALIKEIEKLHRDDNLYDKFISQPKFNIDIAVDYIYTQTTLLHKKIEEILIEKIISKL